MPMAAMARPRDTASGSPCHSFCAAKTSSPYDAANHASTTAVLRYIEPMSRLRRPASERTRPRAAQLRLKGRVSIEFQLEHADTAPLERLRPAIIPFCHSSDPCASAALRERAPPAELPARPAGHQAYYPQPLQPLKRFSITAVSCIDVSILPSPRRLGEERAAETGRGAGSYGRNATNTIRETKRIYLLSGLALLGSILLDSHIEVRPAIFFGGCPTNPRAGAP